MLRHQPYILHKIRSTSAHGPKKRPKGHFTPKALHQADGEALFGTCIFDLIHVTAPFSPDRRPFDGHVNPDPTRTPN